MCIMGLGALVPGLIGGGAAAAGATATAATAATGAVGALQTLATVASIAGTLYSGVSAYGAGKAQEAALRDQMKTEAKLTATQDQRQRGQMQSAIRQQRGRASGARRRPCEPDSRLPGPDRSAELSFDSQAIRSAGSARQAELSNQAQVARAGATASLIKGTVGAASDFVTMGPDVWPGLFREGSWHDHGPAGRHRRRTVRRHPHRAARRWRLCGAGGRGRRAEDGADRPGAARRPHEPRQNRDDQAAGAGISSASRSWATRRRSTPNGRRSRRGSARNT